MTIKAIWLWWTSNGPDSEKVKIRQQTDQMLKRQEVQQAWQKADKADPVH
jgi:hypothetical protein